MKKHYLLGLSLLLAFPTVAQVRSASEPVKLVQSSVGLMAPVWSPDGTKIAMTSDNYSGIFVADAEGNDLTLVTSDAGAGYKMVWSADSRSITGRANIVLPTGIVHQLRSYDVVTRRATDIAPRRRSAAAPGASAAAGIYAAMLENPAEATKTVAALAQFAGKTVINPALSPDGNSIAFQIPGKGMWIINADGSGLRALGTGSHPAWLPDSRTIVYTVVEDNGSEFTASILMSLDTATGNAATVVALPSLLPMTPAVAPDGSKVVFENAFDAAIYVVKLKK